MQTQTATQDHSHVYSKLTPGIVLGDPKEDLEAAVYLIGDEPKASIWRISQNLTDRWGDLNEYLSEQKPLKQLVESPELLERLRGQMWDEISFVVRKDGRYGILFEIEYCSKESEASFYENRETDAWYNNLKSSQENIADLAKALAALQSIPALNSAFRTKTTWSKVEMASGRSSRTVISIKINVKNWAALC